MQIALKLGALLTVLFCSPAHGLDLKVGTYKGKTLRVLEVRSADGKDVEDLKSLFKSCGLDIFAIQRNEKGEIVSADLSSLNFPVNIRVGLQAHAKLAGELVNTKKIYTKIILEFNDKQELAKFTALGNQHGANSDTPLVFEECGDLEFKGDQGLPSLNKDSESVDL